jgi:hypothetical protein
MIQGLKATKQLRIKREEFLRLKYLSSYRIASHCIEMADDGLGLPSIASEHERISVM